MSLPQISFELRLTACGPLGCMSRLDHLAGESHHEARTSGDAARRRHAALQLSIPPSTEVVRRRPEAPGGRIVRCGQSVKL